jgi:hypothetical protein
MLRSIILAGLFVASATAQIWPNHLGKYERKSVMPLADKTPGPENSQTLEFGEEDMEQASYGQFMVLAQVYKDPTGAYAAALTMRDRPLQVGNYLITCTGRCPKDLPALVEKLPKISHAALPTLPNYLPAKNLIPHSERYILGPVGLQAAAPGIPASAVAFDFGAEAALARYRIAGGEATLVIFSYPTMQMARQQAAVLEKLPNVALKRSGPIVALVLADGNQAAADKLLSGLNYQAALSSDDQPLPLVLKPQSAAQMVLAIIALAGIVLGFCLLSGLAFGAFRVLSRRFGYSDAGVPFTTLHLSDK